MIIECKFIELDWVGLYIPDFFSADGKIFEKGMILWSGKNIKIYDVSVVYMCTHEINSMQVILSNSCVCVKEITYYWQ